MALIQKQLRGIVIIWLSQESFCNELLCHCEILAFLTTPVEPVSHAVVESRVIAPFRVLLFPSSLALHSSQSDRRKRGKRGLSTILMPQSSTWETFSHRDNKIIPPHWECLSQWLLKKYEMLPFPSPNLGYESFNVCLWIYTTRSWSNVCVTIC